MSGDLPRPCRAPDDLPASRDPHDLLRPDRVPRRAARPAVLYHLSDYAWTADETELARAFADHMATAIGNARLAESTRTLAERLRAISELAGRLNRLQDVEGIAQAIVAEARPLIDHDTIRVYRVDHDSGMCEPIALPGDVPGRHRPRSGAPAGRHRRWV